MKRWHIISSEVLKAIAAAKGGRILASDLARRLGVGNSHVSYVISRLERRGVVTRLGYQRYAATGKEYSTHDEATTAIQKKLESARCESERLKKVLGEIKTVLDKYL